MERPRSWSNGFALVYFEATEGAQANVRVGTATATRIELVRGSLKHLSGCGPGAAKATPRVREFGLAFSLRRSAGREATGMRQKNQTKVGVRTVYEAKEGIYYQWQVPGRHFNVDLWAME